MSRNRLPPRLKDQILAYMCLKFKAESLNQQQLIEQLPKTIFTSIQQHLFLPIVENVYLFKDVSREIILLLVSRTCHNALLTSLDVHFHAKRFGILRCQMSLIFNLNEQVAVMKAEYIPPREDVIIQNESPDDVYIIVSGEVEMIDCDSDKEIVVWAFKSGDMFGEVGAFCSRPQSLIFRTKTLSQLLRLKTSTLVEAMKTRQEDNVTMLRNFLQVGVSCMSANNCSELKLFTN